MMNYAVTGAIWLICASPEPRVSFRVGYLNNKYANRLILSVKIFTI